jgi:hypothetical protein
LACIAVLAALAACQPANLLVNGNANSQTRLASQGALVHDGGIVFAKNYPPPRLENHRLVPIFLGDDDAEARKLLALTNGQKTGLLPSHGPVPIALGPGLAAGAYGLLVMASRTVGTGAGAPEQEARCALAASSVDQDVPFFAVRPSTENTYKLQAVPTSVDLRPLMPPVRDQGSRQTGVVMATVAMLDYLAMRDPGLPIKQASPQFLNWRYQIQVKSKLVPEREKVWAARDTYQTPFFSLLRIDGNPVAAQDAPYIPALQGYIGEESCPYLPDLPPLPPGVNILTAAREHLGDMLAQRVVDREPLQSQGAFFYRLKTDAATYEAALAGGQPIQLSLPVYAPDWTSGVNAASRYRLAEMSVEKAQDVNNLTYQALVIVGYKKDPEAPGGGWFLLRNSWGTGWGDGGHVRVSYRTIMDFGYAAHVAVAYAKPFGASYDVFPPPDRPEDDPSAGRPLPPISETASWGAYTATSRLKEGDDIKKVPPPPLPVNALGLPQEAGNEGDVYADDKLDPGEYAGPLPGENGAVKPLDDFPAPPLPAQPKAQPVAEPVKAAETTSLTVEAPPTSAPVTTEPTAAPESTVPPATTAPAPAAP